MQRKVTTHKTAYVRDVNATPLGFRHARNRQEKYARKAECVTLTTTHVRHKEDTNGNRYTITQVATASRADVLRQWVGTARGNWSEDGLTFTTTREI